MTRVAIITGAAGGIGRACLELFCQQGWRVLGVDLRPADSLPPGAWFTEQDLAQEDAPAHLVRLVEQKEGRLDALVMAAARQVVAPLEKLTPRDLRQTMDLNLGSILFTAQAARPLLAQSRGALVNIASVHALATSPGLAAYAASKGALTALTRSLALELAPQGIRVNAVLPGAVDTDMLRQGLTRQARTPQELEHALAQLARRHPLGRVGRPEEIARAAYFLADHEQSSFITGQCLVVDGGATARLSTE